MGPRLPHLCNALSFEISFDCALLGQPHSHHVTAMRVS